MGFFTRVFVTWLRGGWQVIVERGWGRVGVPLGEGLWTQWEGLGKG